MVYVKQDILAELLKSVNFCGHRNDFNIVSDLTDDDYTITVFFTYQQDTDYSITVCLADPRSLEIAEDWLQTTIDDCVATLV